MRLFAAIPLTEPVRAHLAAVQTQLRRRGRGSFPVPENFHLTLAFLGETSRETAARAALEALFDTFASGGQLIQPNETVAYVGIPAAPRG